MGDYSYTVTKPLWNTNLSTNTVSWTSGSPALFQHMFQEQCSDPPLSWFLAASGPVPAGNIPQTPRTLWKKIQHRLYSSLTIFMSWCLFQIKTCSVDASYTVHRTCDFLLGSPTITACSSVTVNYHKHRVLVSIHRIGKMSWRGWGKTMKYKPSFSSSANFSLTLCIFSALGVNNIS